MSHRGRFLSALLVALALPVSGCGSAPVIDTLVTSSTSGPVVTTAEISPSARVLAEVHRVGADLVEGQFAANAALDPIAASVEVWERANRRLAALAPTDATEAVVAGWVQTTQDYADLFEEYGPALRDPARAEASLVDFLVENTRLAEANTALDQEVLELTIAELSSRGDPLSTYLAEVSVQRLGSNAVVVDLFAALELLMTDPVGATRAMERAVDEILLVGERIAALTPPPAAVELHDRQRALLADYGTAFSELMDSLESGALLPPADVMRTLDQVAAEAPALNAANARLLADALAGDVN